MASSRASSTRVKRRGKQNLELFSVHFVSTPIFRAISAQNPSQLLSLIHKGEDINVTDPECLSSYLHVVVQTADTLSEEKLVPMVYQLSNAGIDVNARDYKDRTALELAILRELQHLMAALMRIGVDPTDKDYKSLIREMKSPVKCHLSDMLEKYEPGLWASVTQNNTAMVHMLLNSWCRVNVNKNGITLLQFARGTNKSPDLIEILDDFEVTLEFVHATLAGDEKRMLEFLMDSKPCDPYIMDISYQESWTKPLQPRSLRDAALAMGHTHVLQLLPEDENELETATKVANRTQDTDTTASERTRISDSIVPDPDTSFGSSFEHDNTGSNLSSGQTTKSKKSKVKKRTSHSGSKRLSAEVNSELTESLWENFYYHPDSYLQMPQRCARTNSALRGKGLQYVVKDYADSRKRTPRGKASEKELKSKLCVIS